MSSKNNKNFISKASYIIFAFFLILVANLSCQSKFLKSKDDDLIKNNEYEGLVEIKTLKEPLPTKDSIPNTSPNTDKNSKKAKSTTAPETPTSKTSSKGGKSMSLRLPLYENNLGFEARSRRPPVDPFSPGEKIVLALTYFNVEAGSLTIEVLPFVEINKRKSYHFKISVKSSKLFNMVYSLDNNADTYVDYETLIPYSHEVHLKESEQNVESRSFFDWKTNKATYWEKKETKKSGLTQRKLSWDLKPFTQNVISALYYIRIFKFEPNQSYNFLVNDEGKMINFTAKFIKREKVKTKYGEFNTILLKPNFEVDGKFKQTGDIFLWLSDDERKFLVQTKMKIKIGAIYGELIEMNK